MFWVQGGWRLFFPSFRGRVPVLHCFVLLGDLVVVALVCFVYPRPLFFFFLGGEIKHFSY